MVLWRVATAAAVAASGALFTTPSHAACQAPMVNSPPGGIVVSCSSAATSYSLTVMAGGVWWYVHCGNLIVAPTQVTWAPGNAASVIPNGCPNAIIVLRAAQPGSTAVGALN